MPPQSHDPACVFCTMASELIIATNPLAFAVGDTSPVTPLHSLIPPRRHVPSCFDLDAAEQPAIHDLPEQLRRDVLASDQSVAGFNIGINAGGVAGQTVFHCHVHLIPRRSPERCVRRQGNIHPRHR